MQAIMPGSSTPKRILEASEEDAYSEQPWVKITKHDRDGYANSTSASRSSSRSSYGRASNVRLLNDEIQSLYVDSETKAIGSQEQNCKSLTL
jgi:hypothetical protein